MKNTSNTILYNNNNYYYHYYFITIVVVPVIKMRMRWVGHVVPMGESKGVHSVLVGKTEGKRQLGRFRRRRENNIKMDLEEVGRGA